MKKSAIVIILIIVAVLFAILYFINTEKSKYNPALFNTVLNGDLSQLLANLNVQDNAGQTILHSAVYNNKMDIIKILLQHGAMLDVKDKRGSAPLHWAAISETSANMVLLLQHGAKIDIIDNFEMTPLHWAISAGKPDNVKVLLAFGASALIKNSRGKTVIDYAHEKDDKVIIGLLEAVVKE